MQALKAASMEAISRKSAVLQRVLTALKVLTAMRVVIAPIVRLSSEVKK